MDVSSIQQQVCLGRNLQALRDVAGDLAARIEGLAEGVRLTLEPACDDTSTAEIGCEDGSSILLGSRRDPVVEARRWLAGQSNIDETQHTIVVVGIGLGYHVAELLNQRKGGLVVVLEPSLAAVHAALRCHNFADDLRLRRLTIVAATDRTGLHRALAGQNIELMLGTQLTQHPATGRAAPLACSQMHREFTEYLQYVRSALVTSLQISTQTCDNILNNLPFYIGSPGVNELKGAFAGRAAVCVAAGPSLRKNMHLLKQVKGRMPIIAVQTVLRTLIDAGIRPDFITSLDYSPLSRRFYESTDDLGDITLIADPKVNPVVPDCYAGPIRMFDNTMANRALGEMPAEHDHIEAGATVAHLNLYFARYLGCDPIILIGQDLGFGENIYYTPGVPIQRTWSPELNRFNSLEMMEWQRIVRFRDQLRKVPDQRGGEIFTDAQMFTYLQQFERDIVGASGQVINATEGGARIAGTVEMPLAEAIESFGSPTADLSVPLPVRHADASARAQTAIECLTTRLDELKQMDEICTRVLDPLREMTDALDDRARFNSLHAKMDPWRRKIESVQGIYNMVGEVIRLADLKRVQMDLGRARQDLDEISERREQLARDIQYVTLLTDGIGKLRRSIQTAIGRLEAMA